MSDISDIIDALRGYQQRIAALETALQSMITTGPVMESEHGKGVRIALPGHTDEKPHLSDWTQNGDATGVSSYRPQKGEQATLIAPYGDRRQAIALPLGHTDAKPNPAADGDETVHFNRDGVRFSSKGGVFTVEVQTSIVLKVGGVSYTLDSSGHTLKGGKVKHEGKDIGATHTHGGVVLGGANTRAPND